MTSKLNLYHGGFVADGASFWPFSHFGSKEAALDRIRVNYEDRMPNSQVNCVLYECEVDIGRNVLDLPDWNVAVPSGILLAYSNAGLLTCSQTQLRELRDSINAIQRSHPFAALQMISAATQHLGVTCLRYPNDHEGVLKEFSYCLPDTTYVEILSRRSVTYEQLCK